MLNDVHCRNKDDSQATTLYAQDVIQVVKCNFNVILLNPTRMFIHTVAVSWGYHNKNTICTKYIWVAYRQQESFTHSSGDWESSGFWCASSFPGSETCLLCILTGWKEQVGNLRPNPTLRGSAFVT